MTQQSRPLYLSRDNSRTVPEERLKSMLSKGTQKEKIEALWAAIKELSMGNSQPDLLLSLSMCVPATKDKRFISLFYQYLETVAVEDEEGNIKDEVLMVCNTIRGHLIHPNEYIRSKAIRSLARIRSPALFDSLREPFLSNLTSQNSISRAAIYSALRWLLRCQRTRPIFEEVLPMLRESIPGERDMLCMCEGYRTLEAVDEEGLLQVYNRMINEVLNRAVNTTNPTNTNSATNPTDIPLEVIKCLMGTAIRLSHREYLCELANIAPKTLFLEASVWLLSSSLTREEAETRANSLMALAEEYLDAHSKRKIFDAVKGAQARGLISGASLGGPLLQMATPGLAQVSPGLTQEILSFCLPLLSSSEARAALKGVVKELVGAPGKEKGPGQVHLLGLLKGLLVLHSVTDSSSVKAATGLLTGAGSTPEAAMCALEYLEAHLDGLDKANRANKKKTDLSGITNQVIKLVAESIPHIEHGKILRRALDALKKAPANCTKHIVDAVVDGVTSESGAASASKCGEEGVFPGASIASLLLALGLQVRVEERAPVLAAALKVYAVAVRNNALDEASGVALLGVAARLALITPEPLAGPAEEKKEEKVLPNMESSLPDTESSLPDKEITMTYSLPKKEKSAITQENLSSLRAVFPLVEAAPEEQEGSRVRTFLGHPQSLGVHELKNTFQMSSAVDPVYAECRVSVSHAEISLDLLLVNQMEKSLEEVELELVTSENIRVAAQPAAIPNMMARTAYTLRATLLMDDPGPGYIAGTISAGRIAGGGSNYHRQHLQEIRFTLTQMLSPKYITKEEFKQKWPLLPWENYFKVSGILCGNYNGYNGYNGCSDYSNSPPSVSVSALAKSWSTALNASVVDERLAEISHKNRTTHTTENEHLLVQNLIAGTKQGKEIYVNAVLQRETNGSISGAFRVRGEKCRLVQAYCRLIAEHLKRVS